MGGSDINRETNNACIPTTGLLCQGNLILISWPDPTEFDAITNLRNNQRVKKWFWDDQPFDLVKNREWLQFQMDRPTESLLSVRWKTNGLFLGTVGWTNWNISLGEALFGRTALDFSNIRLLKNEMPADYEGITLDIGFTIRDFAFEKMNIRRMLCNCFKDNLLSIKLQERVGLQRIGITPFSRRNGEAVEMVEMCLTYEEWLKLKDLPREKVKG
jgi:RimJ/RimL family protein N-acetyltransferase